jgi:hypothetical protein
MAGWMTVIIPATATESEPIQGSAEHVFIPPGRMERSDGTRFSGQDRPRFSVDETDEGLVIVLNEPAREDLHFAVRIEPEPPPPAA